MIKLESKAPQGPLAEKWSKHKAEIKVVSPKSEEICQAILTQMDRGVTLLQGESARRFARRAGIQRQGILHQRFAASRA